MTHIKNVKKKAALTLEQINEIGQFEDVFNHLPDVYFWVKNRDGEFVLANQLFTEKCGEVSEDAILGKTDYDFFPKDRANHYTEDDQKVIETGASLVNRVELAPEGEISLNHFVTSKFPLKNIKGDVIGTIGIARDLDKAKEQVNPFNDMAAVIELIHTNYAEQINIENLAQKAGMSVSLFERRFKSIFQVTPRQYIIDIRLSMACRKIIYSRENLSYIAHACGFYDHSHFTRQFIKKFGIRPKDYRKKHR